MRKDITIYDTPYITLANQLKTKIYTANKHLIKKANNPNQTKHIRNFRI